MAGAVSAQGISLDGISLAKMKQRVRMAVPDVAARLAKAVMETVPDDIVRELSRHIHGDLHARLAAGQPGSDLATGSTYNGEPTIQLWPSEVGSYVGQDTWRTRDQALADVWERTHPSAFRAERIAWLARGRTRRQTGAVHTMSSFSANQAVDPFPNIRTTEAVARFCTTASPQDTLKLFKIKGQVLEEETADLTASEFGQPLCLRNTASVWRPSGGIGGAVPTVTVARPRPPGDIVEPGPYVFSGAVDGWLTQEPFKDVVVELKLRMRAIPQAVPLRDILQVQTYLAMHGVQRAAHVQRVIGTTHVVINMIERDETLWNDIVMPDVQRFVCDVRRLLRGGEEDEAIRHRVLSAAEKTALPLAHLPTAMASELRTAEKTPPFEDVQPVLSAIQTLPTAKAIEDPTSTHLTITVLDHHAIETMVGSTEVHVLPTEKGRANRRRKHSDDDVIRLPAMSRQLTPPANKKRVVIAALRDMLSLSSRVKRTAVPKPYNTRSRSRSR